MYTQEDLINLGFTNYNKSCVLLNKEGQIEVVFIKAKDLNISKEKLAQFYSDIYYLQLTDIQPIIRKSVTLEKAAKTMYMFGCSKQWQAAYASKQDLQSYKTYNQLLMTLQLFTTAYMKE